MMIIIMIITLIIVIKNISWMLAEDIYRHMEVKELLPWKQKGSRKRNRATKDQVMIDKLIVKYFKSKLKLDS